MSISWEGHWPSEHGHYIDTDLAYAFRISRRDSARSIYGPIPSSLEMAMDSSSKVFALVRELHLLKKFSKLLADRNGLVVAF